MSAGRAIVAGVAGLLVGVVGIVAAERLVMRPQATPVARETAPAASADDSALRVLEARVASLESHGPTAAAPAASQGPIAQVHPVTPPPPSEADERANDGAALHARAIEQHRKEGREAAWAARTEASLGSDLSAVAQGIGATVISTECKTTSCVASMEWKSFDAAKASYPAVLHKRYSQACGVEVAMATPEDASSAYRADVVFDCTHARVGD